MKKDQQVLLNMLPRRFSLVSTDNVAHVENIYSLNASDQIQRSHFDRT